MEDAAGLLASRGPVVEVEAGRILVVGDTHGYPEVSEWALRLADKHGAEAVVFLGDYVDRGPWSVENLELLLERMLAEPGRLLLLRGNHESLEMNRYYGFLEEYYSKLGPGRLAPLRRLYSCLPYAARSRGVLLLHGGVPCRECSGGPEEPVSLEELAERLSRLHCRPELDEWSDSLAAQLLWNDPRGDLEWFAPSIRGPGVYYYGRLAWTSFLRANGLSLLVRAHEAVDAHAVWTREGRLLKGVGHGERMGMRELEGSVVTVFSSLYHGAGAGALLIDQEGEFLEFLRYPEG
ncbi:hypothetical protein CF15_01530 [Pyrodictium occultum]|uniref:Serine/threonine specific protein phosphatases domain-containing protein n=2 Tax=Pyrodictium occultum TaxID=2309 RepID=A0A0V8RU06_PYROC|nr:hypothetical protein CF15_01530 [Pyrodictium occultum]